MSPSTAPFPTAPGAPEPVDWTEAGPVSPRFGDVYFSATDGLEESRAVFLQGCGLPEAWAGRRRFVVGELGFGTGLNILALLQSWAAHRPSPDARLSIFSVEGFPLAREDAARALGRWRELEPLAQPLLAAWPKGRRGLHRIEWPELGATLDLMVGDVLPALESWTGAADAWFLDGFAPAKNPQMWSAEVIAAVVARSAPGARLATFTVAGGVRRALQAQGFAVDKRPGFGRKRERLEGRAPGSPAPEAPGLPRVAVVGAGIAGASLVRALRRLGVEPVVVEAISPGAGASGNAAALVTPRLDAAGGVVSRLHAEAFARATALYEAETPEAVIARGALQLQRAEKDAARFARIAVFDGFDPSAVSEVDAAVVSQRLGEAVAVPGLDLTEALVIEPAPVIAAWLNGVVMLSAEIGALEPAGAAWRLLDPAGKVILEAEVVVLAGGHAGAALASMLAIRAVRGQVSTAETPFTGAPAAWGAYAIPTRTGLLFGASHGPGDAGAVTRGDEAADNLVRLAEARPALAALVEAEPRAARGERASIRAALPDHLPVAGELPDHLGVFILGGLGGRGFTLAPLLAEHVAARVVGAPSPLAREIEAVVSPSRKAARKRPEEPAR